MRVQIKTMNQLKDSRLLYEKDMPRFGYIILITVSVLLLLVVAWSIYTPKVYMITSTGVVQSENKNYVMSPYTGKISEIYVEEGSVVEQGDQLFTVESTDLNLQATQLKEQKKEYELQLSQYKKLVKSIEDDTNYFDASKEEDTLYYSTYEAYKSKIAQNQVNVSTYQAYGYTEEQIQKELESNESKITEVYYSTIQSAEASIQEAKTQISSIDAQLTALNEGQGTYAITAFQSGVVHMMMDYDAGMVVQAASAIASISSEQDDYTIIAYVSPSDAARTEVGDTVDVAVGGLSQSVYGTISGTVTKMDSDVTMSESSSNEQSSSTYFKVYIHPDTSYLVSKSGNKVNLSNGMQVEARIQYDEVTYFDYVMDALGVLAR